MAADLVLALDSGSQSSRALLFDRDGQVLGKGQREHAPFLHPEEGAVEQDPQDIRDALFGAVRDCLGGWGGDRTRIAAAAMTTQRNTLLMLDATGSPLGAALSWLDRRSAPVSSEPSGALRFALHALGEDATMSRLIGKSAPRVWRDRCPDKLAQAAKIAPLEAFLHQALTGRLALAPGGCAGVFPYDVKKRAWMSGGPLYPVLGFKKDWLPEIVEALQPIGRLTADAAERTGLSQGLPIFSCGADKQAEALGAGVRPDHPSIGAISLGTASSIMMPTRRPRESRSYAWLTMAGCEPRTWNLEYMVFRGMWTVRWFARELGRDLVERARAEGRAVEALLAEEAADVPPGSDGVMIWPRWSPSLQHPEERGAVVGLGETHRRGHVFRALLEGIAFDLRRGRDILEDATGQRLDAITVGGGGSRSPLAVQILADVLDLPIRKPPSEELSARGAAIVAAVGAGFFGDVGAAVRAMVPEPSVVPPQPEAARVYRRLDTLAFRPGLESLREVAATLREAARG